jgi:hypothetical protein
MRAITFFVSGGSDTNRQRDIAEDTIRRLGQVIESELLLDATLRSWDYRISTPTVVPRGGLAGPSLSNVDRSEALVAIFGARLPSVTQEEIRHQFRRRRDGEPVEVYVFVNPSKLTDRHWEFFGAIEHDFGEAIVFAQYMTNLDFQALLYSTLFNFLFRQLATSTPPLVGRGLAA